MPTPTIDAMIKAPEYHIRAILLALCDDTWIKAKALEHFERLQEFDTPSNELKRKAINDVFVCVQCDEPFTNEDNEHGSCHYHPGELQVNHEDDFWADNDYETWGPVDTPSNREEYPQGFKWDCCEKSGEENGCTMGKHEAHPQRSKKGCGDITEPQDLVSDPEGGHADEDEDEDEDETEE